MDSSSKQPLFQLFEGIADWRRKLDLVRVEAPIPWSESHVSVVYGYILKLDNINSEFKLPKKLHSGEDSYFSYEMVASFMQELQEFFIVPKLHQLCAKNKTNALKQHEVLAAFIDFLLHLLSCKTSFVHPFEDRIEHLKKELRFLVTVLGDTSLLCDELEQVNNLMVEFELVANVAGSFVHSFIFTMTGMFLATRMDDALGALLTYVDHLKDKITNLSFLLPCISKSNITAKTATVDFLFIVDSLLHDLEDLMNQKHNLTVDVKAQVKVLHQQLMIFQSFLKDIKVPRRLDIKEFKGPFMQMRNLAYEAEYLMNSYMVEDVPREYLTIRLPDIIHNIKLVGTELQEIKKNYNNSGVLKVAKGLNTQLSLEAKRTSEIDDITVGLEDETIHILDQLQGGTKHLQIITIFGMPGLGKTTLAKKLYNHPMVSYYFDRRSWCTVSQTYQKKNMLIDILISLEIEFEKLLDKDEESMGEHIYKSLKGRRYLIVMDDIWDSNAWDDFRRYFPDDRCGSRILFTSRNKDAAPPNGIIHRLPFLSNDQCWELLQKKVFHDEPCPPQLQQIGKEIAKNCQGLPLAVVVVAGILSTMDKEESAWKNVGGSLDSYIFSDQNNSIIQILKLSYNCLPDHLKQCFLYFGAFPEDTEIPVKKLKCLWIAEGFISEKETLRNAEIVAEEYLTELIDRSLVMVAKRRSDGGLKACVVHDLLYECLGMAQEENFLKLMKFNYSVYMTHRRLHIRNIKPDSLASREFSVPFGHHIRSSFVSRLESSLNFLNMKLLKVLDLPRNELIDGDGSEHLVHLRYLGIKYMSASIASLANLEFLVVMRPRESPVFISSVIQKLVKLKYLSVPNAHFDKNCNCYRANNLEFLSHVHIDKLEDEEMLKCSPRLRKLKCIFERLIDKQGVYHYPDLSFFTQLESVSMTKLCIESSMEINLPSSIKNLNLCNLSLSGESMSIIGGLPNLKVLKLKYVDFLRKTWDTSDGQFQQLKFLKLHHIYITEWNVASSVHFPKLQQLVL